MATFDVYVFANSDDEICELRNSTFSSATNAPGSVGNPIACSQGDSIRFNYSFSGGASGGTITPDYNGQGSNYWTNTSPTTILSSSNNPVTYQLKSNAVTGSGARARVSGGGENTLVYLNISAPVINPPVISGTSFTYYNNQTRALYYTGTTWFVRTTINLSNNGIGGTLEYGRNTSSDSVSGASWQTDGTTYSFPAYDTPVTNNANTWNHALGQTRYFYASQDRATAGTFDSTGAVLYNYIAPANVSVFSQTVDFGATSKVVNISGTTEDFGGYLNRAAEAYSISLTDFGSGEISASTVSADRIGVVNNRNNEPDVDFTIPNGSLPANTAGAIETYYVYAFRRADWSGKEVYIKTDSFTLTRGAQPITPPVISSVTNNNASAANVTATVNLSNTGLGGTLQYAQTTTNSVPSTGWQSSASFTHPRGTTRYYWASQATNTAGAFDDSGAIAVGYLQPDVDINFSNNPSGNIASDYTGNVVTTVTNGTAGVAYRVLRSTGGNLGCGNTGELTGTTGTITIGDAANELPAEGAAGTFDYAIQARRGTSTGGDGVTWVNTNPLRTFSITRNAPTPVATPTGFAVTDATTSGQRYPVGTGTTNNLTADALSGHTLQFRVDSGSWGTTSSFSHTFGTQRVYEARYVRTSDSAVSATSASITRRVADANITISPVTSIAFDNTTNPLKIADIGGATADTQYRARATGNINGSSVTNLFINAPVATGGAPDINAANPGELPAGGTSATYRIMVRVRTQENGDGLYRFLPTSVANRNWVLARNAAATQPAPFTFTDVPNAALNTAFFATVQITGINTSINVTTTNGAGTRGFYVSSSATASTTASLYTTTAKTATVNQYIHCRVVSASTASQGTFITISAGSPAVIDTFNVTTAQDTAPDDYTFNDRTGQATGTVIPSNTETITGITGSVGVSVTGEGNPQIIINSGSPVTSGTIQNNQTLVVQLTSSGSNSTTRTATVTLGTGSFAQETYSVTTLASGTGGGGGVDGGSGAYGIEIYDTDGTTKVLSPTTRFLTILSPITTFNFGVSGSANDSTDILLDMSDLTVSNSDVYFIDGTLGVTISRLSDRFRLTNVQTQSTVTATFCAVRF